MNGFKCCGVGGLFGRIEAIQCHIQESFSGDSDKPIAIGKARDGDLECLIGEGVGSAEIGMDERLFLRVQVASPVP